MNGDLVRDMAACTALVAGVFAAGVAVEHLRPRGTRWAYARIDELAELATARRPAIMRAPPPLDSNLRLLRPRIPNLRLLRPMGGTS